ncbi:Tetraspanin-3 [Eumeta japonica]|uniref:Tetraspanin-3 n=1 Tax=Eumeta variegata TaxID=151549 RepID=A0A4C1WAT3_EUMVA|nr:Tetraspanin-3 [Eumeta japonica]
MNSKLIMSFWLKFARILAGSTLPALLIQTRTHTHPYTYAPFGVSELVPFNHCDWLKCVGVCACVGVAWAAWENAPSESGEARAGLGVVGAWGSALTLGATLALCGGVRGSPGALAAAFALLALTAVAEAAVAWWGAAHVPQLRDALADHFLLTVQRDYGNVHSRTQIVDAIQDGLQCCGANGPRDWQNSAWSRGTVGDSDSPLDLSVSAAGSYYSVPMSCCEEQVDDETCKQTRVVPAASSGKAGIYGGGCTRHVLTVLTGWARYLLWAGGALLATHALALLLALALCLRVPARPHKA